MTSFVLAAREARKIEFWFCIAEVSRMVALSSAKSQAKKKLFMNKTS